MATSTGYFIYGITDCVTPVKSERDGVAGAQQVTNIPFKQVGILVSTVNGKKVQPTRHNLIAHQQVLEEWMREYAVLPMQFGTVAETKVALQQGIRINLTLIRKHLQYFRGKRELTLKAWWVDSYIYEDILTSYPRLRQQRNRIKQMQGRSVSRDQCIEIGEKVEQALVARGQQEAQVILEEITPAVFDYEKGKIYEDLMFLNVALLVDDTTEPHLDQMVNTIAEKWEGQVRFKYVGPSPPASFVNLRLQF